VRKYIHSNFFFLKNKLNLTGFKRKTQIDSLLKKCKSKAFRTIHEALKNCLKIKLLRLPQNFITNIKIDFNKKYLNKTILEIYKEHGIIESIEDYIEKGYLLENKIDLFRDFSSLTFRQVFEKYLDSRQYIKDYNHIQKREGDGFAILFNYISKVYVVYYEKSIGNKNKNSKNNLNNDNESNDDSIIYNENNECDNNIVDESINKTKQENENENNIAELSNYILSVSTGNMNLSYKTSTEKNPVQNVHITNNININIVNSNANNNVKNKHINNSNINSSNNNNKKVKVNVIVNKNIFDIKKIPKNK
jgi:hypothetical protein